nr:MAG TPA: hypothetical protein [Caudoviricetes sp.]
MESNHEGIKKYRHKGRYRISDLSEKQTCKSQAD